MPEPIMTPVALRSSSDVGCQPESSTASLPATMARWMKRSIFFWSFTGIHSPISSPPALFTPAGIWPATLHGRSLVSNAWMAEMPDSALIRRRQTCSTPIPRGQAMPMPVTTTRRIGCDSSRDFAGSGGLLLLDVVDRILDGADLLGRVLRDFDAECLLEGHHQLDRIEAVGAQVVDERGLGGHLRLLDAEMLHDDLFHLVTDFTHRLCISCSGSPRVDSVGTWPGCRALPEPAPDEAVGRLACFPEARKAGPRTGVPSPACVLASATAQRQETQGDVALRLHGAGVVGIADIRVRPGEAF